ncbi:MAG TPA: hypothetical protein PKV27_13455, partial [Ilumatobacteraceae bacterium]|nr:hypothetical protein [Ilumatobacteraceae bacterium]
SGQSPFSEMVAPALVEPLLAVDESVDEPVGAADEAGVADEAVGAAVEAVDDAGAAVELAVSSLSSPQAAAKTPSVRVRARAVARRLDVWTVEWFRTVTSVVTDRPDDESG